jgi:hypothetical protein
MRIVIPDYELNRRIDRDQVIWDDKLDRYRPGSLCFNNTTGTEDMSVDLIKLLNSPCDSIKEYSNCCLAVFKVELAQRLNQTVVHTPDEGNFAHCDVKGRKTDSIQRKFAKESILMCYVGR